jgi:hypothetical protein
MAAMSGRIYSVGYEGLTVDAMIERLVGSKVTTLVDVRLNPSSRRPGWYRKSLTASLEGAGITYVHEKLLGNPPENRDSFRKGDGEEGRAAMRALLTNGSAPASTASSTWPVTAGWQSCASKGTRALPPPGRHRRGAGDRPVDRGPPRPVTARPLNGRDGR